MRVGKHINYIKIKKNIFNPFFLFYNHHHLLMEFPSIFGDISHLSTFAYGDDDEEEVERVKGGDWGGNAKMGW